MLIYTKENVHCAKAPIHITPECEYVYITQITLIVLHSLGVILLQMHNRCQYFNAYKSNVTQYIYCECMGMEVRKNHCIDLV